jgi:hypothetical protein
MEYLSASLLVELFRHVRSWLANLSRAGQGRKEASRAALRGVIKAARETAVYVRRLEDLGTRDHATEARLAGLWTDLAHALEDLGIHRLAKRCDISGRHWADPSHYDREFLERADVRLERMESLARQILAEVERG